MAVYDSVFVANDGVADQGTLLVDASGTVTGVAEITELGGTGDAEMYNEIDVGQTGTFEIEHQIAGPNDTNNPTTGDWHSQFNRLWVGSDPDEGVDVRLKIVNVSGGTADYYAKGFEAGVDDGS